MAEKQLGELFAGTVYLSELDPDTKKYSAYFQIETDKLEIKAPSDLLEARSRSRENYGQTHTSFAKPKPTEVAFNFTEGNRRIMAAKLSGKIESVTRSVAALSAHPVTLAELDAWVEIGVAHLTGMSVKESAAATAGYVEGVDYEINPRLGLIRPLTGGAILASATVYLSGSAPALTGERIQGASRYTHYYRGYLDGVNLTTNEDVVVTLPNIVVSSNDAQDFLQEKLATTALSGRLMIPAGGGKPYTLDYVKPA